CAKHGTAGADSNKTIASAVRIMAFLFWLGTRSNAEGSWQPRGPTQLPPEIYTKEAPTAFGRTPFRTVANTSIRLRFQVFTDKGLILDSLGPSQYGPRASGAAVKPRSSRVSTAWPTRNRPTTHAIAKVAINRPPKRPRSPQGCAISANGSAGTNPTVLPTVSPASVRPPMRRRWPAVFGLQPSVSGGCWWVPASVG